MEKTTFDNEVTLDKTHYHKLPDVFNWCLEHVGTGSYDSYPGSYRFRDGEDCWKVYVAFGNATFYFKNSSDAAMFSLRWV